MAIDGGISFRHHRGDIVYNITSYSVMSRNVSPALFISDQLLG